mgnify:CR=1 FL=1
MPFPFNPIPNTSVRQFILLAVYIPEQDPQVGRDLIADSTEAMAMAHAFDALVMIPNCDKNVPGLLMAAARVNIPTVFVSGGPMLAGHVKGKKTSLSSMFEAVGAYAVGKMSEEEVKEYEKKTCPTCGSCSGMYTANSMNCCRTTKCHIHSQCIFKCLFGHDISGSDISF